ncbi:MAG: hypothetical protein VB141_13570 [Burkholderia gladioli]
MTKTARQNPLLYLPLDTASADRISIKFHAALEVARRGSADVATARSLAHAALLVDLIADSERSDISRETLDLAKAGLAELIKKGHESDDWMFPDDLLSIITDLVNEHDRQLRECRMSVIVAATERLERRLVRAGCMEEVLQARRSPDKS